MVSDNVTSLKVYPACSHKFCDDYSNNSHHLNLIDLLDTKVNRVLVALGSNHHPEKHINYAHTKFLEYGTLTFSSLFVNPDYTATLNNPKPHYTNQGVIISLDSAQSVQQLVTIFTHIEKTLKRDRKTDKNNQLVTIDIDLLAVTLVSCDADSIYAERDAPQHQQILFASNKSYVNNQQLHNRQHSQTHSLWVGIKERYPLKKHEIVCVNELFTDIQ